MNRYFKRQTSGKRFLAGFLDLVFVVLLSIFLYIPAVHITNAAGWAESYVRLYAYGVTSGLYTANEVGGVYTINEYKDMPRALYLFYVDHPGDDGLPYRGYAPILVENHEFNTADDFYDVILKRGSDDALFDFELFESGDFEPYDVPVLSGKAVAVENFLFTEMEKAYDAFNEYPPVKQLLFDNIRYQALTIVSAYAVSALLLIVVLPLFLKDEVTLGKIVTRTIVLDRFGYKIKPGRAFARNLSIFFFSFILFFTQLYIISFFMGIFTKKNESLYDMIAFTIVADKKTTIPFANGEEELAYRKKLANSLLTIEKRKAENRQAEIAGKSLDLKKDT